MPLGLSKVINSGIKIGAAVIGLFAVARIASGETVNFKQITDPIYSMSEAASKFIQMLSSEGLKWGSFWRNTTGVASEGHQMLNKPSYEGQYIFAVRENNPAYLTTPGLV